MIKLKPYPKYKDPGVPWLGRIPAHWDLVKTKYLFSERVQRGFPNEPLLAATQTKGVIPKDHYENRTVVALKDLHLLKLVEQGDYVISLRSFEGGIEYAHYHGIISPAYTILKPSDRTLRGFFEFFFKSHGFIDSLTLFVTGIREGQNIDYGRLSRAVLPVPPAVEQMAIGRFLRATLTQINRYIRAKRRLIDLLKEQKQVIIHQAVTLGLDPNVRLKPSGIGWLGDVPEHWEATRLKYVAKVQTGLTLGKTYGSAMLETRPYLRVANVQDGYLDLKDIATVHVPASEAVTCELQTGDVLMTEGGDIDKLGRGYIWRGEIPDCLHQNHIFAVRANRGKLPSEYLALLMTSTHGRSYFQFTAKKTTNLASTNSTTLKAFPLFLPAIEEQQRLLDYIAEESSSVDGAISKSRKEIDLIREYRTRLVSDVVTGKLDVRDVELPGLDEADVPEDRDEDTDAEGDELTDTEEAAADADD